MSSYLNTTMSVDPVPRLSLHCIDREFPSYFDVVPKLWSLINMKSLPYTWCTMILQIWTANVNFVKLTVYLGRKKNLVSSFPTDRPLKKGPTQKNLSKKGCFFFTLFIPK